MSQPLTGVLATILDAARAEAKRLDHPRTHPLHIAAALARRDHAQFESDFGADADDRLRAALATLTFDNADRGVEATTIDMINRAGSSPNPWKGVAEALRDTVATLPVPVPVPVPDAGEPHGQDANSSSASGHATPGRPGSDAGPVAENGTGSAPGEISKRSRHLVTVMSGDASLCDRPEVVDRLLEVMGRHQPGTPCVVAQPGAGRTTLLALLAQRLTDGPAPASLAGRRLVRVSPEAVLAADRANALRKVIDDVDPTDILALDDIEVLAALGSPSVDADMLGVVRSLIERKGGAVVTMAASYLNKLDIHNHELLDELTVLELPTLAGHELDEVVARRGAVLASFHAVTFSDDALARAVAPPSPGDRLNHPGLAVERLDIACARAQSRGASEVDADDVRLGVEAGGAGKLDRDELFRRLQQNIKGQDGAIERVIRRLALTRADLDLNPDRPDGVFLFAGPTGVGKTALARALSDALHGPTTKLIRLDMSEYNDEWAVSRLTGPQPGYVGYTEPEGWLTTKVRAHPDAVVLLDEIEKAHPTVWNTFLQVFDAGRLTDARGNVAHFGKTIVIMTSNLGSDAFSASSVGFLEHRPDAVASEAAVVRTVEATMAPELVNRLDQIIVFQPLSESDIDQIAAAEIASTLDRLRERGYDTIVEADVIALVARAGYEPRYGARHLQRSIEQLLLQPLVAHEPGRLTARVADGAISWEAADAS